jgi:hypothetical protein
MARVKILYEPGFMGLLMDSFIPEYRRETFMESVD